MVRAINGSSLEYLKKEKSIQLSSSYTIYYTIQNSHETLSILHSRSHSESIKRHTVQYPIVLYNVYSYFATACKVLILGVMASLYA